LRASWRVLLPKILSARIATVDIASFAIIAWSVSKVCLLTVNTSLYELVIVTH